MYLWMGARLVHPSDFGCVFYDEFGVRYIVYM
jgi:hypothetical protein